jgi:tetratricopeptide (TPR) repeat protein
MSIQDLIFQAKQYQRLNNWQKIIDLLKGEMKEGELGWENPDALSIYGFACSQMKYFEEAEKVYKRLIELDDQKANSWYNLGFVYYQQKKKQEAQQAFTQALALYPDYLLPAYRMGVMLVDSKNYMEALMYLEKGMDIYEKSKNLNYRRRNNKYYIRCMFYKGKALMGLNNYTEAVEMFKKVIERDKPNYIDSFFKYYNLARALYKKGDAELALENMNKVIHQNKRVEYAYFLKAQILRDMKQYQKALEAVDQAMKQRPQGYLHKIKGEILLKMGLIDAAEKEFHIALKKDRKSKHKILLQLAEVAFQRKQLEKARSYAESAIEQKLNEYHSDFAEAHFLLAQILDEMGDHSQAQIEMEKAAELMPVWKMEEEAEIEKEELQKPEQDEDDVPF